MCSNIINKIKGFDCYAEIILDYCKCGFSRERLTVDPCNEAKHAGTMTVTYWILSPITAAFNRASLINGSQNFHIHNKLIRIIQITMNNYNWPAEATHKATTDTNFDIYLCFRGC